MRRVVDGRVRFVGKVSDVMRFVVSVVTVGYTGRQANYPTPSGGWGRGETPRRPRSRATPHGCDQRATRETDGPKMVYRMEEREG